MFEDGPGPGCCANCDKERPDFAHGVFEAVAATLAEPLRQAFRRHLDVHGCETGDLRNPRYVGGFGNCSVAMELFELLPAWDKTLIAGPVVSGGCRVCSPEAEVITVVPPAQFVDHARDALRDDPSLVVSDEKARQPIGVDPT